MNNKDTSVQNIKFALNNTHHAINFRKSSTDDTPKHIKTPEPLSEFLSKISFLRHHSIQIDPQRANIYSSTLFDITQKPFCQYTFLEEKHYVKRGENRTWSSLHYPCGDYLHEINRLYIWRKRQISHRHRYSLKSPHPQCPDAKESVVLFSGGHSSLNPHLSDLNKCPVNCTLSNNASDPRLAVHTLSNERVPLIPNQFSPALSGVLAIEMRGNFAVHSIPAKILNIQFLTSWYRGSDVWINTFYEWEKSCGKEGVPSLSCFLPVGNLTEKGFGFTAVSVLEPFVRNTFLKRFLLLARARNYTMNFSGKVFNVHGQLKTSNRYSQSFYQVKIDQASKFKFCFCFENHIRPDYVTEKLFHCLLAGSLPIYLGPPEAADFVPGGQASFINVLDYPNELALLDYLETLHRNDQAYLEYFKWRNLPFSPQFIRMFDYSTQNNGEKSLACHMCQTFVHEFCS